MIYFDNSATTAVNTMVLRTYTDVATKIMGNPSSLHGLGTTATRLLEASRRQIAELLGVDSQEIFFTSGGISPKYTGKTNPTSLDFGVIFFKCERVSIGIKLQSLKLSLIFLAIYREFPVPEK